MSTRTPPQHGERRCYLAGCRRPECLNAHYKYMSRWRLETARGHQRRTNPGPAAARVHELLNAGWNQVQIANAAGCSHHAIGALRNGANPAINKTIANKILAITPGAPPPPAQYTDATGTIRRLRALVYMGHSIVSIADAIGMHHTALAIVARGNGAQVRVTTEKAVRTIYRQKSHLPGGSQRARNYATKHGWHGPIAWDTHTIDDPAAAPETDGDTKAAA